MAIPKSSNINGSSVYFYDEATDKFIAVCDASPLPVAIISGGGGGSSGTEYTEGDTDASITGTAIMWEDTGDTLRAVSATKPLPVDLGANNDVRVTEFPEEASSSGTISALNEYVEHTVLQGASSLLINIAGTYTGELILQVDATGSGSWQYFKALNGQDFVSGLGANLEGFLFGPIANFKKVRMLASSWTSGSATVTIKTSVAAGTLFMAHPIPTGANLIGRTYKEPRAYTASTQSKATVGTTTGQVFAADSLIKGLYLKNTSLTATISLKWGSSAVAGEGIVLLPGDGMLFDDDFVQNSALNAISDTASTNLAYIIYH